MDEAWERAIETALEGQADASPSAPQTLTLDGVVKCLQGRMPSPIVLERFQTLEHLSLANIGLSSLEKFPRLRNLQRLILSDNRIAGGLEFLVESGLDSLRDLDLSNNRIQYLDDLVPLAHLRLVSLDLYECPVTRISDYRSKVFGMIRSLKYLDKMDSEENERPESDDEEEEDEEEEDDEDPGNGEVDGEDWVVKSMNSVGSSSGVDRIVDVDEAEESDANEETDFGEMEEANGSSRDLRHHLSNGFIVQPVGEDVVEDEDGEDEEYVEDEDDLGEEVDVEVGGEEDDMVEVHEVEDSEEEDGVEEDDDDEEEDEVDEQEDYEVNVEDRDEEGDPLSTSRVISTDGEIDGHDLGEEDENGEIGEENGQVSGEDNEYDVNDEEEEEDFESEYLVQPVRPQPVMEGMGSHLEVGDEEEDDSEEEVDDEEDLDSRPGSSLPSSSSQPNKRKRDNEDEDEDEDDGQDDDSIEDSRSSKRR